MLADRDGHFAIDIACLVHGETYGLEPIWAGRSRYGMQTARKFWLSIDKLKGLNRLDNGASDIVCSVSDSRF